MIRSLIRLIKNRANDYIRLLKFRPLVISKLKYEIFETKYKHTFFGYYDKSPFDINNKKILAIATDHDNILITPKTAVVGFFDIKSHRFFEVDKTTTWCWQQGCRSMWFDKESFIYNKVVENDYGSVVYDIKKNKVVKSFNFPVYDKTSDNKFALSLNFSRLQYFRPGYGYCNYLVESDKEKVLKNDGVYLCDLDKNSKLLIISLDQILNTKPENSMVDAYHYINHLKFSPDNKTFIFYHVWVLNAKRHTRIFVADIDGRIINVLSNNSFMSHDTFKNPDELLIFTKLTQVGYYSHNYKTGKIQSFCPSLESDGHPSYVKDNLVLTDTYPDRVLKEQRLIFAYSKGFDIIAKIYSPSRYFGEFRCDLHPRISKDKSKIAIDMPTFSGRKMLIFENVKSRISRYII